MYGQHLTYEKDGAFLYADDGVPGVVELQNYVVVVGFGAAGAFTDVTDYAGGFALRGIREDGTARS